MSVTSITTANGSGLTASNPTGAVNLNTSILTDNGLSVLGNIDKTFTLSMPTPFVNNISLTDQVNSGASVILQSSGTVSTDTYTLPTAYPTVAGQVLSSDTSGVMSWATGGGGGFPNPVTTDLDMQKNAIQNVSSLTLSNTANTNVISLTSPTVNADITYTLPDAYPTVGGQVLVSSTSGAMSWTNAPASTGFPNPVLTSLDMNNNGIFGVTTFNALGVTANDISAVNTISVTGSTGSTTTTFKHNSAQSSYIELTLPEIAPTDNQVLTSNGSNVLRWDFPSVDNGYLTQNVTLALNGTNINISGTTPFDLFTLPGGGKKYIINLSFQFGSDTSATHQGTSTNLVIKYDVPKPATDIISSNYAINDNGQLANNSIWTTTSHGTVPGSALIISMNSFQFSNIATLTGTTGIFNCSYIRCN